MNGLRSVHGGEDSHLSVEVSAVREDIDGCAVVNGSPEMANMFSVYIRNPMAFHVQDFPRAEGWPDVQRAEAFTFADALADHLGCAVTSQIERPSPAPPIVIAAPSLDATARYLIAQGFGHEIGGGGSVFLSRYFANGWSIWATGGDGQGMPSDGDWMLGVYPPADDPNEGSPDAVMTLAISDGKEDFPGLTIEIAARAAIGCAAPVRLYAIEPQRDLLKGTPEGDDGTQFEICDEAEAEIFAVYDVACGSPGAVLVDDFPTRAAALAFIAECGAIYQKGE